MRIFLICSLIFSGLSSSACSWFFTDAEMNYRFLDQEIIQKPEYTPYLLSENLYYDWDNRWENDIDYNLLDWLNYFNVGFPLSEMDSIVYRSSIEDLENMKAGKTLFLGRYKGNALAKHLIDGGSSDFIDYLIYAKKCEPHAILGNGSPEYYWGDPIEIDSRSMKTLILGGLKGYKETSDLFIRMRYAFQVIRLAHYVSDYPLALRYYQELILDMGLETEVGGLMNEWTRSLVAGANYKLGNNVVSSYHFAQLFAQSNTRKRSGYLTFSIHNDEDWEACLAMAKNPQEESNLWFMIGIDYINNSMTPMMSMLEINPADPNLDVLLVRNLAKAELMLLPKRIDYYSEGELASDDQFISDLESAIHLGRSSDVANMELWHFADGYLNYMLGNFSNAKQSLKMIDGDDGEIENYTDIRAQARTLIILMEVQEMKKIDLKKLDLIAEDIDWLQYLESEFADQAVQFIFEDIARKYFSENGDQHNAQSVLALSCKFQYYDLRYQAHFMPLEELIAFLSRDDLSTFEQLLAKGIEHSVEDLYEMLGTVHLANREPQKAVDAFLNLEPDYETYGYRHYRLYNDPFHAYDPGYVNINEEAYGSFTKLDFAKRLAELEKLVVSDKANRFQHSMSLGIAYMNMGYWGNSWEAGYYWRGSGNASRSESYRFEKLPMEMFKKNTYSLPSIEPDHYDLAIDYFIRASKMTKDREAKAKAYWMAAFCNQHVDNWSMSNIDPGPESYFDILHEEYASTNFYENVILSCSYFRSYWSMPSLENEDGYE